MKKMVLWTIKNKFNTGYSPNLGKGLLGPNGMIYDSEKDLLIV